MADILEAALSVLADDLHTANEHFENKDRLEGSARALAAVMEFLRAAEVDSQARQPLLLLLGEIGALQEGRRGGFLRVPEPDDGRTGTNKLAPIERQRRCGAIAAVELLRELGDTYAAASEAVAKVFKEKPERLLKWRERLPGSDRAIVDRMKAAHLEHGPDRDVVLQITEEWARKTAKAENSPIRPVEVGNE